MNSIKNDAELRYYASLLCKDYVAEMDGHKHLCHEPKRMEDPLGIKKCVKKYCPKLELRRIKK